MFSDAVRGGDTGFQDCDLQLEFSLVASRVQCAFSRMPSQGTDELSSIDRFMHYSMMKWAMRILNSFNREGSRSPGEHSFVLAPFFIEVEYGAASSDWDHDIGVAASQISKIGSAARTELRGA